MPAHPSEDAGGIPASLREGDPATIDRLFGLLYADLRARAHRHLAGQRSGSTLCTTALVHEAYLKLAGARRLDLADEAHFFRLASRAMRQVLVDRARRRLAGKRGGDTHRAELDSARIAVDDVAAELLALDRALSHLEAADADLARVVELRFFAGFSVQDTGRLLGLSERTVKRRWRTARAILHDELAGRPA